MQTTLTPPEGMDEIMPEYLFRVRVQLNGPSGDRSFIHVNGSVAQISANGDLAIQTWDNRRVLGLKADLWLYWMIVDPETLEPSKRDFPYDDKDSNNN